MFCVNIVLYISVIFMLHIKHSVQRTWITTDDLEYHISPDDLRDFQNILNEVANKDSSTRPPALDYAEYQESTQFPSPGVVDCFGLGPATQMLLQSMLNMKPDHSNRVNTHFYFSSRLQHMKGLVVYPGEQFGLEHVDFKPSRKTVVIVHGFMSHSNASWVNDMTAAFLHWGDVNVIAVDWSGGGNTWKYWRAVANTRTVGHDVTEFLKKLMEETGIKPKDMHFVGHSLGAHISSYVAYHLGGVSRITGLDPALPCFQSATHVDRLDKNDADFVDVIHTNGRRMNYAGFGIPDALGDADFYPNGGMNQPGCFKRANTVLARMIPAWPLKLQEAICSHGRAYLLFTESLVNTNCTFHGYRWNLTYEGVNGSLQVPCIRGGACAEMGIKAVGGKGAPRAAGPYFVLTTDKEPYCALQKSQQQPRLDLLHDLLAKNRFASSTPLPPSTRDAVPEDPKIKAVITTAKSWFTRWFGR